jgi:hypothetical protein
MPKSLVAPRAAPDVASKPTTRGTTTAWDHCCLSGAFHMGGVVASRKDGEVKYKANNKARLVTRSHAGVSPIVTGQMCAIRCANLA